MQSNQLVVSLMILSAGVTTNVLSATKVANGAR